MEHSNDTFDFAAQIDALEQNNHYQEQREHELENNELDRYYGGYEGDYNKDAHEEEFEEQEEAYYDERDDILYDAAVIPQRIRSYRFVRKMLLGYIVISIINLLFSSLFNTPKIYRINMENQNIEEKCYLLQSRIEAAENKLLEISHRNNHVYRPLFALDTLALTGRDEPYPASLYEQYDGTQYSPLIMDSWNQMDMLAMNLYLQSKSLDELQALAKNKEELSMAIPAVWPIDRTLLKYGIGAFGMRMHPIYKRPIMHQGVDLACNTGSPVYATGDAVVQHSSQGLPTTGYGQMLLLKHKFGYQTRYAHLSKRLVNVGDTVKRGDLIGLIGNTGGSTGPHLHYEVILRGQPVNPLNFFNRNMSKEDYQRLMEQVQETHFEKFED